MSEVDQEGRPSSEASLVKSSGVKYQLRLFFTAVQFFTRLPIPRWVGFDPQWLSRATRYLPAVGLLIAILCAGVYAILVYCLPKSVAILLSTVAGIYFTGALHEDGFADVCDGFGGGSQPQRVMEIMRDSRLGTFGVLGLVLLVAVKLVTLTSLPVEKIAPALLVAHPFSRGCVAGLIWGMKYVREEGKAKPMVQQMTVIEFVVSTLTALCPLMLCGMSGWLPWSALLLASAVALVAVMFLVRLFQRRLGGYTGDCLGAVQQLSEVAIYIGLLAGLSPALSL
ncbi:adenosylcobinamide-GDP ribazoletransferase [Herbaspirillum sp. Sphag64]|uniref:adenosylcobinamide-GDP ribazoletransferase n=1 Tax=Herbaspirillum sp. Sphag64 TaxID=2587029 RepID=UPI00351CB571